ncbi:MAG: flippase-like domain-containing protein [Chloroflexi bacterium]|nr:flippase-like domain-containing protein [Chloroflexota bacterium]
MPKQRQAAIFGVLLLIGLLIIVISSVDLGSVWAALTSADYRLLPLVIALVVASLFTRAVRWAVMLRHGLSLRRSFDISNVGYMFNSLLPLRAGEVARVLLAARHDPPIPVFTTASTILLERIIDLLFLFVLLGLTLTALPAPDYIGVSGLTLAVGAIVGFGALLVFAHRRAWALWLLNTLLRWLPFLRKLPLENYLNRFLDGLSVLTSARSFALMLFWSLLSWMLTAATGYVLLYAFFGQADWAVVLLFIVTSTLFATAAAAIAYTPGAIGPYQAGIVLALSLSGFSEPEGAPLAFAVVIHAVNLGIYIIFGMIGLWRESITPEELFQRIRAFIRSQPQQPPTSIENSSAD